MPELRFNIVTGQWVVIETSAGTMPSDFVKTNSLQIEVPNISRACHFCKGNEHILQEELYRVSSGDEWIVRVIKNRFSRLSEEGDMQRQGDSFTQSARAVGIHEIVIETPYHNHSLHNLSTENIVEIIKAWRLRFVEINKVDTVKHILLFKNYGLSSGTQIEHSLSHIVGLPIVPTEHRTRTSAYINYYDDTGTCLMCELVDKELRTAQRLVMHTRHFAAFVPFAALSPFHVWIFPLRHSVSIAELSDEEVADFAYILKSTISKIYYGLNDPDYNFTIRMSKPNECGSYHMHWYMSIVPRVGYFSGFEMSSGMFFNPLLPEKAAEFLRQQAVL